MSNQDFAISAIGSVPNVATISKKPIYLVTLEDSSGKKNTFQRFVAIDKPDSQNGFLCVKGFYTDLLDEEISKTFFDVLTSTSKDLYLDIWFPWHRVLSVKSLVFNANKAQTLVR